MSCFRIAFALLSFAACSTNEVYNQDGGVPDASPTEAALLEIEGETTVGLLFGETTHIVVTYSELDGTRIANESLRFALVGRAHDSSVSDLMVTTNDRGRAEVEITAGTTAASFRLQVSADRAAPVYVDVSVSNAGFGALRATLEFSGRREIARYTIMLRSGLPCGEAIASLDPPDRTQSVTVDRAEALFATLPAEVVYSVIARGLGPTDVPIALGCVDGVTVLADREEQVTVELADLPLDYAGDYGVELDLDTAPAATRLEGAIAGAASAPILAAGGDAPFLLDAVERVLESRGATSELGAVRTLRRSGDLDAQLGSAYEGTDRGPLASVADIAELASSHAERVSISGTLGLDPMGTYWGATRVTGHTSDVAGPRVSIDLATLGADPTVLLAASVDTTNDQLAIETFSLSVPLGVLGRGILLGLADARGLDLPALIGETFGCEELRTLAAAQPSLGAACDDMCIVEACNLALDDLASVVIESLPALDLERDRFHLTGTAKLDDLDADGRVTGFSMGEISGAWRARDGRDGDTVSGELVGARMLE